MDRDKNLSNVLTSFRNVSQAVTNLRDTDLLNPHGLSTKLNLIMFFAYKFSDGDVSKIKELIGELRDSINSNGMLSENHRKRLLFKLESLDKEFHKIMSDLSKFWDLFGEAALMSRMGTPDLKPAVGIITKIMRIVWSVQATANQLISGTDFPGLPTQVLKSDANA